MMIDFLISTGISFSVGVFFGAAIVICWMKDGKDGGAE